MAFALTRLAFFPLAFAAFVSIVSGVARASSTPNPALGQPYYNGGGIVIAPYSTYNEYASYNVRWEKGTVLDSKAHQDNVSSGAPFKGTYRLFTSQPGVYSFIVQGCRYAPIRIGPSSCTPWSKPVRASVPSGIPVRTVIIHEGNHWTGDCRMQNATLALTSDGVLTFSAQVMTTHTRSGDYWHAGIALLDTISSPLVFFDTMTSMRLAQGHPWYTWTWSTRYDGTLLSRVALLQMKNRCLASQPGSAATTLLRV